VLLNENKEADSNGELHLHYSNSAMQMKYFLLLFVLSSFHFSYSQFSKGSRVIGVSVASGMFSAGSTKYSYPTAPGYVTDSKKFSLSITPSYGIFLNNQTIAGASLLLQSTYEKLNNKSLNDTIFSSTESSNTDFGAGVFLRYYFSIDKNFRPFIHLYLSGGSGFGSSNGFSYGTDFFGAYKESYDGKSSGRAFMNAGLNFGFTKMISQQVGLDAFAGYLFSYSKYKTETTDLRDYTSPAAPDLTQKFQPSQKFTGNSVNLGVGIQVFIKK
jgi:hypothetical protein